jgi:hypothetical protein
MPSGRQAIVALLLGAVLLMLGAWQALRSADRVLEAGFWFEPVTYGEGEAMVDRLGGPLTPEELDTIKGVAASEVAKAFAGLPLVVSDRSDAMFRVRVVQELLNVRAPKYPGPAGESRAIPGYGGQGAVNFRQLVSSAVAYAPPGAERAMVVAAIGRGVGRTAVHEFAHQLLGSTTLDSTADRSSYEFRSADRREQFYGDAHWSTAWPLLQKRLRVR